MRTMKLQTFLYLLVLSISLSACTEYNRVKKGNDYQAKEAKARELFAKKKYARAQPLFDEVMAVVTGTSRAEEIYYFLGYCHYHMGDYLLANYYFKTLASAFLGSPRREEADYMAAYCHYVDSPRDPLDQTSTYDAIREMQDFINRYPQSERVAKATELIEELRAKLELKTYKKALLYYHLEYYNSAAIAFQTLMKDFPDTKRREESIFMVVKSYYLYASNSVKAKQKDRFKQVLLYYTNNLDKFAGSNYQSKANVYYDKAEIMVSLLTQEEMGVSSSKERRKLTKKNKKTKEE